MDDSEWAVFLEFDRNIETADILNDNYAVIIRMVVMTMMYHHMLYMNARVISRELRILLWNRTIQNY